VHAFLLDFADTFFRNVAKPNLRTLPPRPAWQSQNFGRLAGRIFLSQLTWILVRQRSPCFRFPVASMQRNAAVLLYRSGGAGWNLERVHAFCWILLTLFSATWRNLRTSPPGKSEFRSIGGKDFLSQLHNTWILFVKDLHASEFPVASATQRERARWQLGITAF
jgi:hypothetical protein